MKVFSAIGGSGSTYMIERLAERFEVGNKPDTVFRPDYPDLWIPKLRIDQGTFLARSGGFEVRPGAGLEETLRDYLAWLDSRPRAVTVLNTCAEVGLFSRLSVPGVIFQVRHPLHAYGSIVKEHRHGDIFEALGGIEGETSIARFARRWSRVAQEIARLRDAGILGGVVRTEYAQADAAALGLSWLYESFDSSRRNRDAIGDRAASRLRDRVWPAFASLYGEDWDI